jgi:hypothetical protein
VPDPIVLYRLCPTCHGSGQVRDDRFPADARVGCTRPCTACVSRRVVPAGPEHSVVAGDAKGHVPSCGG